jgi:hypothetical protein
VQLGRGSGGTTSPDPAHHNDAAYETWCWNNDRDPFDDDAHEQFDIEMSWFPDGEDWK